MKAFQYIFLSVLLIIAVPVFAKSLQGKVVKVADGDTITVLDGKNRTHKIRLIGIDAPEKKQPFGNKSREHLSNFVSGKFVDIEYKKKDRYKRILGKILLENRDINLELIKAGLAWHYKHFEKDQTPEDRTLYSEEELKAKSQNLGLWSDPTSSPPWEFRKSKRTNKLIAKP